MSHQLGIDVGGTFTDFVAYDREKKVVEVWKELSTPTDPVVGIIGGLDRYGSDRAAVDCAVVHKPPVSAAAASSARRPLARRKASPIAASFVPAAAAAALSPASSCRDAGSGSLSAVASQSPCRSFNSLR